MGLGVDSLIGGIILALGGLVWLIRLEGRVVAHDHQVNDTRVTNEQEHAQIRSANEQDHDQLREELHYIRMRIDQLANTSKMKL